MLLFIEKFNGLISSASSEEMLIDALKSVSLEFGFRSAYLIDYLNDIGGELSVLDTRPDRMSWWRDNVIGLNRPPSPEVAGLFDAGGVIRFDPSKSFRPDHPYLASLQALDFAQPTMVPVTHDNKAVGIAGYVGWPDLSDEQQLALQVLTYNLFTQRRVLRQLANGPAANRLTPREREVMSLAASGKTSIAMAEELGLSARTINQHVENVGVKLGTRNRTHTIAESIRQNLLH